MSTGACAPCDGQWQCDAAPRAPWPAPAWLRPFSSGSATVGAGCARGARLPAPGGAAALGWSRGVGDMCGVAGLVSRCGPAVRRVPAVATTCGAKRRPGRAGALENQIPENGCWRGRVGRRGACRGRRRRGVGRPRSATRTQPSRQPGQRGTEPGGRGRRFQVNAKRESSRSSSPCASGS